MTQFIRNNRLMSMPSSDSRVSVSRIINWTNGNLHLLPNRQKN
jgi:hypothetical protein